MQSSSARPAHELRLIQNDEQIQLTSIVTSVCKQKNHMLPIEHVRQHARQARVTPGHMARSGMRGGVDAIAQIHKSLHGNLKSNKMSVHTHIDRMSVLRKYCVNAANLQPARCGRRSRCTAKSSIFIKIATGRKIHNVKMAHAS